MLARWPDDWRVDLTLALGLAGAEPKAFSRRPISFCAGELRGRWPGWAGATAGLKPVETTGARGGIGELT